MIKVLLLSAGGTQALPIAESLVRYGCEVHGLFGGRLTYGYHSRFIKHKALLPQRCGEAEYAAFLAGYLERNGVDVAIPLSDVSATVLSRHKKELSRYGRFVIPDYSVFARGYDKGLLMKLCMENGLPHPRTVHAEDEKGVNDTSMYPALIKPDITTGGRGMRIVRSPEEFRSAYPAIKNAYGGCHLQEYIPPGGRQLKVQLFIDPRGGEYSSVMHKVRFYPASGGSSCCNITILDDHAVEVCRRALGILGWEGFADFDLIEDPRDGAVKIMELNPRIPACIRSAIESGMDYGRIITDAALGREQAEYNYIPGKSLRHIGLDIINRFSRGGGNVPRPLRGDRFCQDFSRKDPLPFFFGTSGSILKLSGLKKSRTV